MSNIDEKLASIPTSPLLAERMTKEQPSRESNTEITRCSNDTISRQAAIEKFKPWLKVKGYSEGELNMLRAVIYELEHMPPAEPWPIRCRDCYWWTKQEASLQGRCALTGTYPTGAFFCGNARQRPYPCDPEKNRDCSKTGCYINGGECRHTLNREYRREEE